jgi:GDP-fucose transporter C1
MVSAAVRGVASSLLGMWLFHDIITSYVSPSSIFPCLTNLSALSGRASSIAIILGGSIYYTWIKHIESQPKPGYERVRMEDVETGKESEGAK